MDNLKSIWNKLTSRYTNDVVLVDSLWTEIEKSYTTKKRYYHNLTHLEYMVDKAVEHQESLADTATILFSIFYHDIIYNISRQDNEQKSADTAKDRLIKIGLPSQQINACQKQIIATKDHKGNGDSDTNFLLDFDLAILGEVPVIYQEYVKKIRNEYSLYPDFLYKRGRKKVLHHFLGLEYIFKTKNFQDNYEQQARENLEMELQKL